MQACIVRFTSLLICTAALSVHAEAGWLSQDSSCGNEDCSPSCASPRECAIVTPDCCSPTSCLPATPNCCTPNVPMHDCVTDYDSCDGVEIDCDGNSVRASDGCVKRSFKKLMELERRKNRCLIDTFFGWRNKDRSDCHGMDCAPNYYYQSQRVAPHACH